MDAEDERERISEPGAGAARPRERRAEGDDLARQEPADRELTRHVVVEPEPEADVEPAHGDARRRVGEAGERGVSTADERVRLEVADRHVEAELGAEVPVFEIGEERDATAHADRHEEQAHVREDADERPDAGRLDRSAVAAARERRQPELLNPDLGLQREPLEPASGVLVLGLAERALGVRPGRLRLALRLPRRRSRRSRRRGGVVRSRSGRPRGGGREPTVRLARRRLLRSGRAREEEGDDEQRGRESHRSFPSSSASRSPSAVVSTGSPAIAYFPSTHRTRSASRQAVEQNGRVARCSPCGSVGFRQKGQRVTAEASNRGAAAAG